METKVEVTLADSMLNAAISDIKKSDTVSFTMSILRGTSAGINDILEMVQHPIDNVIYPISRLIYDATLIAAHHINEINPEVALLHNYLRRHPEAYEMAIYRMHQLVNGLKDLNDAFWQSNSFARTEMIARGLTGVLVPGYVIKGAGAAIKAARANQLNFGTTLRPPVFGMVDKFKDIKTHQQIPSVTATEIACAQGDITYIFALTEAQELLFAQRTRSTSLIGFSNIANHHQDLAKLQRVFAAGEVHVTNGQITKITNFSGHYQPFGHAGMAPLVEHAFESAGLQAAGCFQNLFPYDPTRAIKLKTKQITDLFTSEKLSTIQKSKIGSAVLASIFLSHTSTDEKEHDVSYTSEASNLSEWEKLTIFLRRLDPNTDRPIKAHIETNPDSKTEQNDPKLKQHVIGLFQHASISKRRVSSSKTEFTDTSDDLNPEQILVKETYYKQCYELTERTEKLREHFRTGNPLQLNQSHHEVSFSDSCRTISNAANDLAIIATSWHLPGGRELSIIGKGTERIAAGSILLCMENAPAFATSLGWLSVVAGIAVLTTLGDETDENDAIAELKLALVQLGMMLKQVLQNQQKIADTLDVILKSVLDVEARVKQHQTETRATLSFISTYQLQDACLAIQGDLAKTNAVSLTSDARREALSILERWLNQHLFHAGISREASGPTSSKLAVETLASYPAMNTMGFILVQLQAHLGAEHVPNEFLHLPPLNLFIHVAQLFLTGILSTELPSDDGCEALCKKLVDIVQIYEKLIHHLRMESVIWDALFKQYEHQRNMVGRALAAANIPNQAVPIDSLVSNDLKRRNLMDALDQMEERRLLLVRLIEFAFDGHLKTVLHQKVQALESKQHILSTPASSFHQYRGTQYYYPENATKDDSGMQLALRAGVDLNLAHLGGNVLNYIGCRMVNEWGNRPYAKQWETDLMHLVMRHSSANERLDASMMSIYRPAGTWPEDNYAMTMASNKSRYGFALLLMIAGFSKPWDRESLLNSDWAAESSNMAREYQMFLSSTIRPDGILNRYKLARAFEYYQACENGEVQKANTMIQEGVDADCVLWLVALLGNWSVFERLNRPIHLAQTLGTFKFTASHHYRGYVTLELSHDPAVSPWRTSHSDGQVRFSQQAKYTPLMVAAEHGRIDVIEGLIHQQEVGCDIGISHTLLWGASAATLAFTQGHFDIAQRLYDLGSPLTTQEVDALNAKVLPHAPLTVAPNPLLAILEQSRIETHDSLQTGSLNDMVSSIQDFSMIFKLKLNAKIDLLEKAFAEQEKLFKHCVAFDAVVHRVQILVLNQMLSPNVLEHLRESQMQLHSLYYRLQKQLQKIAETYHVEYEGMAYTPKLDAPTLIAHDELSNISAIRQQLLSAFETRVSSLANDLGISLDKTLDLIHDLADYLQRMPATTKESALILFGSTGVGKSTLFNFLTGCLYQEEINEEDGNVFREKISGVELSEVGHGAQAKTIFPIVADLPDKPYALIDMPGSTDNRGKKDASMMSPYDLSAAVSMKYVIKRFDTIKGILVVCPDDQLTPERPPLELQEVFQQVGRMIMDKPHLSANIMLGITKQGRLTLKQVLGRLRNIAKAFTEDEAMSTFLNAFLQDPNAEGRLLFMDVISEPERACYFDRFDEKFMPQPTKDYHFEEYSHRLDKLRRLLTQLSESRQQSHQELMEQQLELDVLNSLEETQQRNLNIEATIPQFLPVDSHDLSLDELAQFQNQLLCICERTTQLNGLLHRIDRIEEALTHKKELSQKIEQLKCQEEIESDFHQRLGLLCVYQDEQFTSSSTVSIRGTLFNPNRSNVHQHSSQHAATVTQDYTV